jgi:hypothetical protein
MNRHPIHTFKNILADHRNSKSMIINRILDVEFCPDTGSDVNIVPQNIIQVLLEKEKEKEEEIRLHIKKGKNKK